MQKSLVDAPHNYIYSEGDVNIEVSVQADDVWLTQKQMSVLFGVAINTVNEHVKNVIKEDKLPDSTIRKIRIVAEDGKSREINHYGLDVVIPVGYRVGSPQAAAFRKWANDILKRYILTGIAVNEKRIGSKATRKLEDAVKFYERNGLQNRPEFERLSRLYDNKKGGELTIALVHDVCYNPNFGQIKGLEYFSLFGFFANDLKAMLNTKSIRDSLPDLQLQAFTLAETALRTVLNGQGEMSNEQVLEAIRMTFHPVATYIKGLSDTMGVHHVTGKPLLAEKN